MEVDLNTLIDWFEDYENTTIEQRDQIELERDYYDNKQYIDSEIDTLNLRKQPVITFNLIKRTVDAILGLEQQSRTDPKAWPRTPQHEEDADAITDSIRYVCDNEDFDQVASAEFFNLLVEGTGVIDVSVRESRGDIEVSLTHVNWDRFFYDPHCRRKDFKDAKFYGITIWMDLEDAIDRWPDAKDVLENSFQADSAFDDTFDDTPRTTWTAKDEKRKRLRVNQIYYNTSKGWYLAFYTKGGFVVEPELSPYLDEDGQPESSIVAGSSFIDRDGNRYGYVRQLISPQDEVNKRRSKALHHISQRQTFSNQKSGVDAQTVKREMAKPDGHIVIPNGEFGRDFGIIPTTDMAQGNFQLLQEAKDMFSTIGTNTAVTGIGDGGVRSGRAEQFRQVAGTRELTPVLDVHRGIKRQVYRKVWNRIKQFWDKERWIRVTDDEKNMKWVGLNAPITVRDQLEEDIKQASPEQQQQLTQLLQQSVQSGDPRLDVPVGTKNKLSEIDVDIILEETPDFANIQQEQFELVTQMYQANPQGIPWESVIELSQIRNKDKILDRINGDEQQQQAQAQKAQQQEQIQMTMIQTELEKTESETEKNLAQAQKAQAEAVETLERDNRVAQ